ncbi:MAG: BlaI/MecI/CopY family transcriptional regulator [Lachnospiraceae bacterium]|nr:BlaI/MecI/CopY family transcriptional regulator [Lachnospiraceae bacterium]
MTPQALSDNEFTIMKLLWDAGRPLTRAEILNGTEGRTWNPASIHLILNSMLSKGVIAITDAQVKYGRTYEAVLGRDEYVVEGIKRLLPYASEAQALEIVRDAVKKRLKELKKEGE